MTTVRIPFVNYKGILPSLDRRQPSEPFVIDGRNFIFDIKGAKSWFGGQFYQYWKYANPEVMQTVEAGDEIFLFTDKHVFSFDEEIREFIPRYTYALNLQIFPWSTAFVGGKYYFTKKGSPLIEYDPVSNSWNVITDPNIPAGLVACTQAGGRLVLLGGVSVAWSVLGNGTDLTPDPDTGAGFQLLAFIGGGDPLAVREVGNGFVTYTRNGIMHSQIVDALVPFRHTSLSVETRPLNPFCIADIDKRVHIVLARTGFYVISGRQPEPWQPVMGEFFKNRLFSDIDPSLNGVVSLFYDSDRQIFLVSIASSNVVKEYQIAYALYFPKDEWSTFDHVHIDFLILPSAPQEIGTTSLCYIDPEGKIKYFTTEGRDEIFERAPNFVYRAPDAVIPIRTEGDVHYFTTTAVGDTIPDESFSDLFGWFDLHTRDELFSPPLDADDSGLPNLISTNPIVNQPFSDGTFFTDGTGFKLAALFTSEMVIESGIVQFLTLPYMLQFTGLDSFMEIGLLRLAGRERSDVLSQFHNLLVSTEEVPAANLIEEDWLTFQPETEVDWLNEDLPAEDWGLGVSLSFDYSAVVRGLIDGYNLYEQEEMEFVVVQDSLNLREYSGSVTGLYASVKFVADAVNERYHVRAVEVDGYDVGLL